MRLIARLDAALAITRRASQRRQLCVQRLHIDGRVDDDAGVQQGGEGEELPVAVVVHVLPGEVPGGEGVAERAEHADGSHEVVAHDPADGPCFAEERGALGVFGRGGRWEVDDEGREGHEGLGYCVAWDEEISRRGWGKWRMGLGTDEGEVNGNASCDDELGERHRVVSVS